MVERDLGTTWDACVRDQSGHLGPAPLLLIQFPVNAPCTADDGLSVRSLPTLGESGNEAPGFALAQPVTGNQGVNQRDLSCVDSPVVSSILEGELCQRWDWMPALWVSQIQLPLHHSCTIQDDCTLPLQSLGC